MQSWQKSNCSNYGSDSKTRVRKTTQTRMFASQVKQLQSNGHTLNKGKSAVQSFIIMLYCLFVNDLRQIDGFLHQ
jgi:hypothetical protein